MNRTPVIAATIGDPAGIGPECCVKALADGALDAVCRPVLIGDVAVVRDIARICGVDRPIRVIEQPSDRVEGEICVIDPGTLPAGQCRYGEPSAAAGRAVLSWIRLGESLGARGDIDGLVFAPVDSTSLRMAGAVKDLDDLQPAGTFMFRVSGPLRVVPITEHIPMRDIAATVKSERILHLVRLLHSNLRRWGLAAPRIAVAGLNPHAMFEEDEREIAPAVAQARAAGIDAAGPISPDSVFRLTIEGRYDAVVTMYHDQGQIAVKTSAFAGACTIVMGMRYVMLHVPHGSALDIAGRGVAQHLSVVAAFRTAAALAAGNGFLTDP